MQMHDTIGVRLIVYFSSQLALIDRELRNSDMLEVSDKYPPKAYLDAEFLRRIGLTHVNRKQKESGYSSIHYTVRLKGNVLEQISEQKELPYFEIQVRTLAQELWSELEHVLAYKPENRPNHSAKRRLQILSKEVEAVDEQFNLLYEELIHNQEVATYNDSDLLNFENLPKVLMEVGVQCALNDLNPILKIFSSRGIISIKDLLEIVTPRRLATIRNTYMSKLGHSPDALELIAALAALKGVGSADAEIDRIQAQIEYQQSSLQN